MLAKKTLSLQICNELFLVVFILFFMGCSNSEKDSPSTEDPVSGDDPTEESTPEEEPTPAEEQENITWKNWYLSVPINRGNGKATSIFYETIENNELTTDYVMLYDYVSNGYRYDNYFKTGNYFKWNSDYTQSAEVILYSAKTRHN